MEAHLVGSNLRWFLVSLAAASFISCGVAKSPAHTKDIEVVRNVLECRASWSCSSRDLSGEIFETYVRPLWSSISLDPAACEGLLHRKLIKEWMCSDATIDRSTIKAEVVDRLMTVASEGSGFGQRIVDRLASAEKLLKENCTGAVECDSWIRGIGLHADLTRELSSEAKAKSLPCSDRLIRKINSYTNSNGFCGYSFRNGTLSQCFDFAENMEKLIDGAQNLCPQEKSSIRRCARYRCGY
jgi:hypothetical protein